MIDTNVLLYAGDPLSPQYAASRALLGRGVAGATPDLHLVTPVLLEYLAISTDPRRARQPLTVEEAWDDVERYRGLFSVLRQPPDLLDQLAGLLGIVQPKGAEIFDLVIAATMLSAGVTTVYSYDRRLFGRVPGVTVLEP